jgi:hypothetical protein
MCHNIRQGGFCDIHPIDLKDYIPFPQTQVFDNNIAVSIACRSTSNRVSALKKTNVYASCVANHCRTIQMTGEKLGRRWELSCQAMLPHPSRYTNRRNGSKRVYRRPWLPLTSQRVLYRGERHDPMFQVMR